MTATGKKTQVVVTGTANKNKIGMQKKIDRIAEQLSEPDPKK